MKAIRERDALCVLRSTARKIAKIHREFRTAIKKREQLRLLELTQLAAVVTAFQSELQQTVDGVRSRLWDGKAAPQTGVGSTENADVRP